MERFLEDGAADGSIFRTCLVDSEGLGDEALLQCVSQSLDESYTNSQRDRDQWFLVICGALVFFMQTGFAMLCAGCVRKKNVRNTMLKNLLDACGAAMSFYCVGYAFAFGGQNDRTDKTFIGTDNFFSRGEVDQGFWFFQYAFSATAVTIVAGTLAERCQMAAYLCYSVFLTGFTYPVVVHAIWSNNGFLSAFAVDRYRGIGVIDFAGSGVIHTTGGFTALIATVILGPRKGRFHDNRGRLLPTPRKIQGHSIALQLMGTVVLWFGWYGFNPGSAILLTEASSTGRVAALAAVNTSLAAATGASSALFGNLYLEARRTGEHNFDLTKAMNGLLSGLVAITSPCGTVENWAACCIGAIAGILYLISSSALVKVRIDDAVDAIPVHMVNGVWGMLATGLFSSPGKTLDAFGSEEHVGFFYSLGRGSFDGTLFGNQVLATAFIMGWVATTMLPFFLLLNTMGWFRTDSLEELIGLDHIYMDIQETQSQGHDDFNDESVGSEGRETVKIEKNPTKGPMKARPHVRRDDPTQMSIWNASTASESVSKAVQREMAEVRAEKEVMSELEQAAAESLAVQQAMLQMDE